MQHRFYYSPSHERHMIYLSQIHDGMYNHTFVNGIKYTEMTTSECEPMSNKHFGDDLVKVYEGDPDSYKITSKKLY